KLYMYLQVENPVRKRDRSKLDTSMAGLAAYALKASGAMPGDVMFIGSVSGRNVPVVDLALEAKRMGLTVIALTSMTYSPQVSSDHPCGKRLFELADLVLDNCAPAAEAMMDVEGLEPKMCAASGLSAAFLMWSVTTVAVEAMLQKGMTPGVLKSANFPGGNEFNAEVIRHYEEFGW
ncbi:MAG: sugar isomerase domain-containing protein, partial [Clostridia bacterium]